MANNFTKVVLTSIDLTVGREKGVAHSQKQKFQNRNVGIFYGFYDTFRDLPRVLPQYEEA